jgi:hypothetical protein
MMGGETVAFASAPCFPSLPPLESHSVEVNILLNVCCDGLELVDEIEQLLRDQFVKPGVNDGSR